MTEPDEALLWAREDYASLFTQYSPDVSERILNGFWDDHESIVRRATSHRAAASAERIKELEGAIQKAAARLQDYADMTVDQWAESVADGGITAWMVIRQELRTVVAGSLARALLKEPD